MGPYIGDLILRSSPGSGLMSTNLNQVTILIRAIYGLYRDV